MKYLIFLFLMVGLTNCASTSIDENLPFKISESSFSSWVGGQPGVRGIRIIMTYESSEEVDFQKIYFQNKEGEVEVYRRNGKSYLIGTIHTGKRKGNSLIIDIDPKNEMQNEVPKIVNPPIKINKNEAALLYVYKGKEYYYKVLKIKEKEFDFYP